MAVAYRSIATKAYSGGAATCNKPSGVVSGDELVAAIYSDGTPSITGPSGWARQMTDTVGSGGDTWTFEVWTKLAGGSEPASYTWGSANGNTIHIVAASGPDATTPVNVVGVVANGTGDTATASSVTTTVADCLLIGFFNNFWGAAWNTAPSGMTERGDADGLGAFTQSLSGTGATGTRAAVAGSTFGATNASILIAIAPTSSGTTYNQSAAGTLTTAGVAAKQTGKRPAGTLTSGGALIKQAGKAITGTLTTAGAALKQTARSLGGTLTSGGAVAFVRGYVRSFGGTLSSAGSLAKQAGKPVSGALTSAGALTKQLARTLAGTLSSSGTLSSLRTFLRTVGGTLATAGALVRQTSKPLAGVLSGSGGLIRQTARAIVGMLTTSGTLGAIRTFVRAVGGTLSTAGAISKQTARSLSGGLSSVGATLKQTRRALVGALTSGGALARQTQRLLSGTLGTSGAIIRQTRKAVAGAISTAGAITRRIGKALSGVLGFLGGLLSSGGTDAPTVGTVTITRSAASVAVGTSASTVGLSLAYPTVSITVEPI